MWNVRYDKTTAIFSNSEGEVVQIPLEALVKVNGDNIFDILVDRIVEQYTKMGFEDVYVMGANKDTIDDVTIHFYLPDDTYCVVNRKNNTISMGEYRMGPYDSTESDMETNSFDSREDMEKFIQDLTV